MLDFNDLLLITRDLLDNVDGADTLDYFRKRFRQVMVDEFQDTNPLQYGIIRALQGDGHLFHGGGCQTGHLSFHRQRRACLPRPGAADHRHGRRWRRMPMTVNYRSRREILGVLNGLFTRVWPAESGVQRGDFFFEPLTAGLHFADKLQPSVELLLADG